MQKNVIGLKGQKGMNMFGLVFVRKGGKFSEVDYKDEDID